MKKLILLFVVVTCFVANAKPQEALTPRDAFWSASDLRDIAPNPAVPNKDQPITTEKLSPAPTSKIQEKTVKIVEHSKGASRKGPTSTPSNPKLLASKGYGAEPHLVKFSSQAQKPLGLRYALLKVGEAGEVSEALPETIFHSGDKVKISLMANQLGFIYIIQQGSSGSWRPLFPAQGDLPASNRVEAGRIYEVPAGKSFQFNQQTGNERLFILLSRQVVTDLDRFIFTLQQEKKDPATPASSAPTQEEARNRISDDLVQSLKSRDLMEVQDPPQETKDTSFGEHAMYVVSQGKGNNAPSQVFATLILDHR
jgi:Domain of unknown function (DUF4384)